MRGMTPDTHTSDPDINGHNLQQRHRIAIHDDAPRPRTQRPHDATDCAWLRGLHEDVPAPASLEPLDRARRRSEHAERTGEPLGIGPDEPPGHTRARPLDPAGVLMRRHEP